MSRLAFLTAFLVAATAVAQPRIAPQAIRAHIDFLASDLLEGRETGSRGYDIAAQYVAAQFAAAKLEPAGDNGTFFQTIRFRTARLDPAGCSFTVEDGATQKEFVHRKDLVISPDFLHTSSSVDGPVVFAGFGITAPELHHDDYAGLDARGKIVIVLSGAPPKFPNDQRAFYSDTIGKQRLAAAHGAVALLTLRTRIDEKRFPFEKSTKQSDMRAMRFLEVDGTPADTVPEIKATAALGPDAAAALFAHAAIPLEQILDDAEKSISRSFPLNVQASIRTASIHGTATSENVIARLRGSDPALSGENVVISAHVDHLGMAANGVDRIYNGALDNASGSAALIEIAKAFAALPQAPKRSIVFAAVTGEEKGEQGSHYFAEHPTVPQGSIVADVNMDMFTMLFPVKDVIALGADHSSLDTPARDAAARAGFDVSPDPQPEEVRFVRSDQYSFVKEGIPSMTFKAGTKSSDPAIDGDAITRNWLRNVYHSVRDNPDQKLDYASGARWADANFDLVLAIANSPSRPTWKPGDFFGEKFGAEEHDGTDGTDGTDRTDR